MPYLTEDEYKRIRHVATTPENFQELLDLASGYMNQVTQHFYEFKDLETDIEFRKNHFKRAVAIQIAYMLDNSVTSTEQLKLQPLSTSQTIGKTSISKSFSAKYSTSADGPVPSINSVDAINELSGTGLLSRKIGGAYD